MKKAINLTIPELKNLLRIRLEKEQLKNEFVTKMCTLNDEEATQYIIATNKRINLLNKELQQTTKL